MTSDQQPNQTPQANPQAVVSPGQPVAVPPHIIAMLQAGQRAGQALPVGIGVQSQQKRWQGQFPPPEAIERYEKVLPGAFDRIIALAERSQADQITSILKAQEFARNDVKRGQWLGFSLGLAALAASLAALAMGSTAVALTCLSVAVLGVAKALVDSSKAAAALKAPTQKQASAPAVRPAANP